MALLSPAATFVDGGATKHIDVPDGAQLDDPIVIDVDLDAAPAAHTVVTLGEGARASVIERIRGGTAGVDTTLTREAALAARAELTYTVVQTANAGARVVATRRSEVGSDATMRWNVALVGSAAAVDTLVSRHAAAGASTEIAAVFFPVRRETVELTTEVRHDERDTSSQTVVRSIAAGRGRGRYYGNIRIAAHAHGSEASLRDDTLLIGSNAKIDAIPALEIAANDVKAFHGATVGAIDDEHIFYAMSRGIDRSTAEKLIALGFFEPALSRFPGDALRDELRTLLEAKLALE